MDEVNLFSFQSFQYKTITKQQLYQRYSILTQYEEELSDCGKELDNCHLTEFSNLINLIIRDKREVLFQNEKIYIDQSNYYCVQFRENWDKVEKLNKSIHSYLELKAIDQMMEAFKTNDWYKEAILNQLHSNCEDTLEALRNSHNTNINVINNLKRLESLQIDIITTNIYADLQLLFSKVSEFYVEQKKCNEFCNKKILKILSIYRQITSSGDLKQQLEFSENSLQKKEKKLIKKLVETEQNFQSFIHRTTRIIENSFKKVIEELARLAPSYKVFIINSKRYLISPNETLLGTVKKRYFDLTASYIEHVLIPYKLSQKVDAYCSNYAIWEIERVDAKMLNNTGYALASISHSIQQIVSNWKIKMRLFEQKFRQFNNYFNDRKIITSEEIVLEKFLEKILFFQSICIQNEKNSYEIDICLKKEQELLSRKVVPMKKGEKVFIKNSILQKYLICSEKLAFNEVSYEVSDIFFTDQKDNDNAIWNLIDNGKGIIIENIFSKKHLTVLPEKHIIIPTPYGDIKRKDPDEVKVVGSSNPCLEGIYWKLIRLDHLLMQVKTYAHIDPDK